jgi:hypothetical protein
MKLAPCLRSLRSPTAATYRPRRRQRYSSTFTAALGIDEPRGRSRRAAGASAWWAKKTNAVAPTMYTESMIDDSVSTRDPAAPKTPGATSWKISYPRTMAEMRAMSTEMKLTAAT